MSINDNIHEPGATITNIQRFSVHDGPGIRTLIFFKGCPLRCAWCSNPENINPGKEVMQTKDQCFKCRKCILSCKREALHEEGDLIIADPKICDLCGECENICPFSNIQITGKDYTVKELMDIILKDRVFFDRTSGGVTFSGGEPTVYLDFLLELLKELKENGINSAIETCGYFDFNSFSVLIPFLDLVYFDLKIIDRTLHRRYTGMDNANILDNLKKISDPGNEIIIRFPFIPGFTDDISNIMAIIKVMHENKLKRLDILPYHRLGKEKYKKLGLDYKLKDRSPAVVLDKLEDIKTLFKKNSIEVLVGG